MKTSFIPAVRVEPELRERLQGVLGEGESLSSFVEGAVRDRIERRSAQHEFVPRGVRALQGFRVEGRTVSTEQVLRKPRARLKRARRCAPARR